MKQTISWLIIGSRRWARVITEELCKITEDKVYVYHDVKDVDLSIWKETSCNYSNIKFVNKIMPIDVSSVGIAIVANSAYLHHYTIKDALTAGYNVVSEKPLSFSKKDTLSLIEAAEEKRLKLLSSNTFCFAKYLKTLKENWLVNKKISMIEICWSDPVTESRYGERKRYDSGVPIIYDILPHIATILNETVGQIKIQTSDIKVSSGGSCVNINYQDTKMEVDIFLKRNAQERLRDIKYYTDGSVVNFNFTDEPGEVSLNGGQSIGLEPNFKIQRKPLAAMLYSLKDQFEKNTNDSRLSVDVALYGNELIDAISDKYVDQIIHYLNSSIIDNKHTETESFTYAIKEMQSLVQRVAPYLSKKSPLKGIINFYNSLAAQKIRS